jgi:hypothetical protein
MSLKPLRDGLGLACPIVVENPMQVELREDSAVDRAQEFRKCPVVMMRGQALVVQGSGKQRYKKGCHSILHRSLRGKDHQKGGLSFGYGLGPMRHARFEIETIARAKFELLVSADVSHFSRDHQEELLAGVLAQLEFGFVAIQ